MINIETEMTQMGTKNNKKGQPLTKIQQKFISEIKNSDLCDALEVCNWTDEKFEKLLSTNCSFKKAYYEAKGLTLKQAEFLRIFPKKLCNISKTCTAMSINRKTFYRWKESNPEFAQEVENTREGFYDDVENIVYEKIFIEKDTSVLIYFTKTRMKHRGYVERQEHNVNANVKGQAEILNRYAGMSIEELDEIEKDLRKKAGLK